MGSNDRHETMKWSWKVLLIHCCLLAVFSFAGNLISGHIFEDEKLVISESEQIPLAMFFGSLGASLLLCIVGAFRGWRLSHLLAAVTIVAGLFGGSVAAATFVLILAAIVSLMLAKTVQVLPYYFPASHSSQDSDSEQADASGQSETH